MMAFDPYSIWESAAKIGPREISRDLSKLVTFAVLAANSHNTQPWKFVVCAKTIKILPDLNRPLRYGDRANREMYISLGCALANILVAAASVSWESKIEYLPETDYENPAAIITFKKGKKRDIFSDLVPYITKRVTNRFPYDPRPIDQKIIKDMEKFGKLFRINVSFIMDRKLMNKIASLEYELGLDIYSDKIFKKELSEWVRATNSARPDGMPLFDMEIPKILSGFAPKMLKIMPAKLLASREKNLLLTSSAFLILSVKFDNKEEWLRTGITFQLISLLATKMGICFCPWGGFSEHPEGNLQIKELSEAPGRVVFFARMGYPKKIQPHSPRRPIADVLVKC